MISIRLINELDLNHDNVILKIILDCPPTTIYCLSVCFFYYFYQRCSGSLSHENNLDMIARVTHFRVSSVRVETRGFFFWKKKLEVMLSTRESVNIL